MLVDEAPPPEELDRIEAAIAARPARRRWSATTSSAPAARGPAATSTSTSSSATGTTLEDAHELAHRLRDAIEAEIPDSDVLIHVEPEGALHDPDTRETQPYRAG